MAGTTKQAQARVMQAPTQGKEPSTELVISNETRALFASMAMAVPDGDESGAEQIILAILNAKSWDELDDPWNSARADALLNVELRIDSLTRRPSSFADGLGIFLVVHGIRMDTKEPAVWTTGSVGTVAQLVKAYMLGALPLYAVLRQAERPTERGYYPHHLEIMGSGATGEADA